MIFYNYYWSYIIVPVAEKFLLLGLAYKSGLNVYCFLILVQMHCEFAWQEVSNIFSLIIAFWRRHRIAPNL